MRKWRLDVEHAQCGIDLQDGLPKLLDLRFADDILLFARTGSCGAFLGSCSARRTTWIRSGRRIEEHLVKANLVIDKSWSVNMPIWIISLDLYFGELYPNKVSLTI